MLPLSIFHVNPAPAQLFDPKKPMALRHSQSHLLAGGEGVFANCEQDVSEVEFARHCVPVINDDLEKSFGPRFCPSQQSTAMRHGTSSRLLNESSVFCRKLHISSLSRSEP